MRQPRIEQHTNKRDFLEVCEAAQNSAQTRGTFQMVCEAAQNRTMHKQEGLFIRFVRLPRTEQCTNKRDVLEVCEEAQNRTVHKQEGLLSGL